MLQHHSVRAFTNEPVPEDALQAILVSALSAATSSNQNSWSVVTVRDPERKKRLMESTGSNPFIAQAPVFFVWVADLSRAHRLAEAQGVDPVVLHYQEALLIATVDAALAAQNAVVAAESLGLGTCYVGGIRTQIDTVSELLNLPEYSYPVLGLSVGCPSPDDSAGVKPRLPLSAVAFDEQYDATAADAGIPVLERETSEYFASQGVAHHSWSEKSLIRWSSMRALRGRENNRGVIAARGLLDE
jgi:nitroreductase